MLLLERCLVPRLVYADNARPEHHLRNLRNLFRHLSGVHSQKYIPWVKVWPEPAGRSPFPALQVCQRACHMAAATNLANRPYVLAPGSRMAVVRNKKTPLKECQCVQKACVFVGTLGTP